MSMLTAGMSEAPVSLGDFRLRISYDQQRNPAAKVVVLGDSNVGKSSILTYLKSGYTADRLKQKSTLGTTCFGEFYLKVDGGSARLEMWDTCGGEQFRTFTTNYFRGAHGAVLVYDVTRKDTLTNLFQDHKGRWQEVIPSWLDQFLNHFKESDAPLADGEPPHIAILGNKVDITTKRMVSEEEARETIDCEMKRRELEYLFYETSACSGQNLDDFAKQFASKFERCRIVAPNHQGIVLNSPGPPPRPRRSQCCNKA